MPIDYSAETNKYKTGAPFQRSPINILGSYDWLRFYGLQK
jgi:hypothetical protein